MLTFVYMYVLCIYYFTYHTCTYTYTYTYCPLSPSSGVTKIVPFSLSWLLVLIADVALWHPSFSGKAN